jgi:predicted metal-dependent peptidase
METDIRMTRARAQLIQSQPFFGSLAMRLLLIERQDIETLATDGKHLFYRPGFLDELDEDLTRFGVAHEVLHCALGHHTRRGGRDPKQWNIACDYVINQMLYVAGFKMPNWVYRDQKYNGLNAEQVYRLLEEQEQDKQGAPKPQAGGTKSGRITSPTPNFEERDKADPDLLPSTGCTNDPANCGQPEGECPCAYEQGKFSDSETLAPSNDPGHIGEILDAAPAHDKAALDEAADEWAVYTRQAVNIARRQGEGRLPGYLEEVVQTLNDPQTDWRTVLRRFVDPSNTKDYSWSMPNRRFVSLGYYTPGMISDGVNHVALLVDTSASVSHQWLQKFGCEAQAALDDGAIDKITVVFADTQVHRVAEYNQGETIDFTVAGRGGTEFAPTFDWLNKNEPGVSAAIYFTDLECSSFGPKPDYPVLWAAYSDNPRMIRSYMDKVPFGECVELK